uniref:Lysine decarboxylase n=1 Tax=Alexandrium catenella TaxID=2925 RepID=A0A7S1S0V6_ALECA|mmetsp:Transcript_80724/g.214295  ORF Transcript_80724/g.214295 Transcript_80724/m.214295 type:complete len:327 (+) Transcript_80724:80-1060(+)
MAAAAADASEARPNGETEEHKELTENVPTVKAYKNVDFLTAAGSRHIRILCEVQEPAKRLNENGVDNYMLFLGSHLLVHPEDRAKQIGDLERQVKAGGPRDEIEALSAKIRFFKKLQPMDRYYDEARKLGERIARWSKERQQRGSPGYHVVSGGGPGIMEAANKGASSVGEFTMGFGSTRPEWGRMNKFVSPEGAFAFHYFFMRKFWMAYKCMGLIVFPGGYGSLDELFEFLSLVSSKKITHNLPIILMGKDHWKQAINFDYLVECGMLSTEHRELMVTVETAEEAFDHLVKQVNMANETGENEVVEDAKRRRLCKTPSNAGHKAD